MEYTCIYDKLKAVCPDIKRDEPMHRHTTFKIGGVADYFAMPHSFEEIRALIELCSELKLNYCIVGNGSNLLVKDKGFRGVIIQLYKNCSDKEISGCINFMKKLSKHLRALMCR